MIAKRPTHRTRVGKRNQVTIPVEMLRQLGVQPGESVRLTLTEDKMIRIEKATDPIAHALGLLHRPGMKPLSDKELEDVIREARRAHGEQAAADDARIMRESRGHNG